MSQHLITAPHHLTGTTWWEANGGHLASLLLYLSGFNREHKEWLVWFSPAPQLYLVWAHPTVTSASCPEKSSTGTLNQFCVFSNQKPWPQILLRAKPFLRLFPTLSFLRKQTEHMFLGLLPTRWVGVTINFYARWLPNVSKYLRWGLVGWFVLWSSGFGRYQSSWNNFQAKSEPKFPSEFFFPTAVPNLQKGTAFLSMPCSSPPTSSRQCGHKHGDRAAPQHLLLFNCTAETIHESYATYWKICRKTLWELLSFLSEEHKKAKGGGGDFVSNIHLLLLLFCM